MKTHHSRLTSQLGSIRGGVLVVFVATLLPAMAIYGITSYFRLSSDVGALRNAVITAIPGRQDTKITANVGPLTIGLARLGLSFLQLPAEARMALSAARGAEVAIYKVEQCAQDADFAPVIGKADKTMSKRGWLRVVGVSTGRELVAVYMPAKGSTRRLNCCVVVWHEQDLVIAAARANPEPLIELVSRQMDLEHHLPQLARR